MDSLKSSGLTGGEGQILARQALGSQAEKSGDDGGLSFFMDCLDRIENSPLSTPGEKALAAFGKSIGPEGTPSSDGMEARALKTVVEYIACSGASAQGITGNVIAGAALKAQNEVGGGFFATGKARWAYRDSILDKAFLAIRGSICTSNNEKDLAQFGLDIAYSDGFSKTMTRARGVVMSAIACPSKGPIAALIAETVLKAHRKGDSFEASTILYRGFEAIASNRRVPAPVREFAEKGKDAYDCPGIPDPIDEKNAFLPVMKKMPEEALKGEAGEALRKEHESRESLLQFADDALGNGPAALTVEEEFVDIDGVRIDRQQHRGR